MCKFSMMLSYVPKIIKFKVKVGKHQYRKADFKDLIMKKMDPFKLKNGPSGILECLTLGNLGRQFTDTVCWYCHLVCKSAVLQIKTYATKLHCLLNT